jgi:hypothetical protein
MKGDFTRLTFDPTKHYSRVLQQQGRVQLDSDFNEMASIQAYFLRRLAADLIGPHGGPGFAIGGKDANNQDVQRDLAIGNGHYYVDGILCENDLPLLYSGQPGFSDADRPEAGKIYLAYLDVWERHVTAFEDQDENKIGIQEVALRGPDTTTRGEIVWQVKSKFVPDAETAKQLTVDDPANPGKRDDTIRAFLASSAFGGGNLRARALRPNDDDEPCLVSPQAHYRGAENQLYRVEIHRGGPAWDGTRDKTTNQPTGNHDKAATFKWSRDNGSVIFPIANLEGEVVTLASPGRDAHFGLRPDDWVEIVDDDYVLRNRADALLQVKDVNRQTLQVTLKSAPSPTVGRDATRHRLLRRWDQHANATEEGAVLVFEGAVNDESSWITLEDGVQIQFVAPPNPVVTGNVVKGDVVVADKTKAGDADVGDVNRTGAQVASSYRTGDYWLIPARVATGDVDWPGPPKNPIPRPPYGVEHSYAPLGIVTFDGSGKITTPVTDLRRPIKQLSS